MIMRVQVACCQSGVVSRVLSVSAAEDHSAAATLPERQSQLAVITARADPRAAQRPTAASWNVRGSLSLS